LPKITPNCLHYQRALIGPGFFLHLILSVTPGSGFVKNIKIKEAFFFFFKKEKEIKKKAKKKREFKNRWFMIFKKLKEPRILIK
jgi:hypothetical protein